MGQVAAATLIGIGLIESEFEVEGLFIPADRKLIERAPYSRETGFEVGFILNRSENRTSVEAPFLLEENIIVKSEIAFGFGVETLINPGIFIPVKMIPGVESHYDKMKKSLIGRL